MIAHRVLPTPRAAARGMIAAALFLLLPGPTTAEAQPAQAAPAGTTADFTGLWQTSYGRVRLVQHDTTVTGRYLHAGDDAAIEGRVDGRRLVFRYVESDAAGSGAFDLAPDAASFDGTWRTDGDERERKWSGTRVVPVPDRVWLVVLEAHWEEDLAEREYAFGDMLRGYFQMAAAQHVEVRHRYFHDETDFRRFARAVAYLAEPVVLLVSTHGTEEGVQVGAETIGASAIAQSLRGAGNVELLHLSGCLMMNGPVPAEIQRALPAAECFPISGYATTVDWAASAIADFTYLSLVLIHRIAPQEAARRAIVASPYIGTAPGGDPHFAPLGLRVLLPEPARSAPQPPPQPTPERDAR